jgi:glycosyltransferase involved in cell wall biosynthesis
VNRIRVAFDREIFVRQNVGGVSRVFAELIYQLAVDPSLGVIPELTFTRASNRHLLDRLRSLGLELPPLRPSFRGLPRLLNGPDPMKDAFLGYRAGRLARQSTELMHATYLRPLRREVVGAGRIVCTIQDTIGEQLGLPAKHPSRRGVAELLGRSQAVVTTTQSTADRVASLYSTANIHIIPLGVDHEFFGRSRPRASRLSFPYVLFVGTRAGYKNFGVLLAAMRIIQRRIDLGLVVAGPPVNGQELKDISSAVAPGRFLCVTPDDDELAMLYQHAQAFVFPSTHEGFGLPALEAAVAGTPVLLADTPTFRDVGLGFAQYFQPSDAEALAELIESNAAARPEPSRSIANLGTWRQFAESHARLYATLT